jgi:hypothetical protein
MHNVFVEILDTIRESYDLVYGIMCSPRGDVFAESGDKESLPWTGLYNSLFGSPEAIITLYNSLSEQILPQEFAQGDMYCFVDTPTDGYLVGLFGHGPVDPLTHHQRGKQITEAVEAAIKTAHRSSDSQRDRLDVTMTEGRAAHG